MDIEEVKWRLQDHFRVHDDGCETPYLDEAVEMMYKILEEYYKITKRFGSFEEIMMMDKPTFEERKRYDGFWNEGFGSGAWFAIFMLRGTIKKSITDHDIVKLAHWFELKYDFRNFQEWYRIITDALDLDEENAL